MKDAILNLTNLRKTPVQKKEVEVAECQECWRMYMVKLGCLFCTKYAIDKSNTSV